MNSKSSLCIRKFCVACQGGHATSVKLCADSSCPLFSYRNGNNEDTARPKWAIRKYCFICSGSRQDIRNCNAKKDCALWSYRFGISPKTFKKVVARLNKQKQESLPGLNLKNS